MGKISFNARQHREAAKRALDEGGEAPEDRAAMEHFQRNVLGADQPQSPPASGAGAFATGRSTGGYEPDEGATGVEAFAAVPAVAEVDREDRPAASVPTAAPASVSASVAAVVPPPPPAAASLAVFGAVPQTGSMTLFITLPAEVVAAYLSQLAAAGLGAQQLGDLLAQRLTSAAGYDSPTGFWISDSDRQSMSRALSSSLTSPAELVAAVNHLASIRLRDSTGAEIIDVPLDRDLLRRVAQFSNASLPVERLLIDGAIWGIRTKAGLS